MSPHRRATREDEVSSVDILHTLFFVAALAGQLASPWRQGALQVEALWITREHVGFSAVYLALLSPTETKAIIT